MSVVSRERLKAFMSSPGWSAQQDETAELVCAAVEESLEAALFGTFITPRPWVETAPVLAGTGLVDTTYPVFTVTRLDGGPLLTPADPPPGEYRLLRHRLYRTPVGADPQTPAAGWPFVPSGEHSARQMYTGTVRVEYEAGWGPDNALILAILRKAQTLMGNRHDDTVTVRGLTASSPTKLAPEDWTEAELKPLGRYRRLGVGGR